MESRKKKKRKKSRIWEFEGDLKKTKKQMYFIGPFFFKLLINGC